jgi:hypothetical protein
VGIAVVGTCSFRREFKAGLRRWHVIFDVTPRDDLANALSALAAARGMTYEIESWFRDHRSWRLRGEQPKAAGFIRQTPATK